MAFPPFQLFRYKTLAAASTSQFLPHPNYSEIMLVPLIPTTPLLRTWWAPLASFAWTTARTSYLVSPNFPCRPAIYSQDSSQNDLLK